MTTSAHAQCPASPTSCCTVPTGWFGKTTLPPLETLRIAPNIAELNESLDAANDYVALGENGDTVYLMSHEHCTSENYVAAHNQGVLQSFAINYGVLDDYGISDPTIFLRTGETDHLDVYFNDSGSFEIVENVPALFGRTAQTSSVVATSRVRSGR